MALYMFPNTQGRDADCEFYVRRTNYCMCNPYAGGEETAGGIPLADADNPADIPRTQDIREPCPR